MAYNYDDIPPACFDLFPEILLKFADKVYYGEMKKGVFIGKYMEKIKQLDIESYQRQHFKYPQFVSRKSSERSNNWLDFMLNLGENEFFEFKRGLKTDELPIDVQLKNELASLENRLRCYHEGKYGRSTVKMHVELKKIERMQELMKGYARQKEN